VTTWPVAERSWSAALFRWIVDDRTRYCFTVARTGGLARRARLKVEEWLPRARGPVRSRGQETRSVPAWRCWTRRCGWRRTSQSPGTRRARGGVTRSPAELGDGQALDVSARTDAATRADCCPRLPGSGITCPGARQKRPAQPDGTARAGPKIAPWAARPGDAVRRCNGGGASFTLHQPPAGRRDHRLAPRLKVAGGTFWDQGRYR